MDEIVAIFYAYQESSDYDETGDVYRSGVVAVENDRMNPKRLRDHSIETTKTELELLNRITDIIVELDPDILAGWEVQTSSWGYCDARGKTYGRAFVSRYSRVTIFFRIRLPRASFSGPRKTAKFDDRG